VLLTQADNGLKAQDNPLEAAGLERFHNSRALSGIVQGDIYFHPSD
jgi:hypothetical protein